MKKYPGEEQHKKIKNSIESKILGFLGHKPRATNEIQKAGMRYLQGYALTSQEKESIVSEIISSLKKMDYLNDVEYVYSYIIEQQQRKLPRGPRYIYGFLRKKGVSTELIKHSLEEHFPREKEIACINKILSCKDIPSAKLAVYLLRRGFSGDLVYSFIDSNSKNH
jgi:SOS response regulatory protein OraA/RecX